MAVSELSHEEVEVVRRELKGMSDDVHGNHLSNACSCCSH